MEDKKVSWMWGGKKYSGKLIKKTANKTYALTHNGKVKVISHLRKTKRGTCVVNQHQRTKKLLNPKGGLSAAGRKAYNKEGHNLKPGVKNYSEASEKDKKRWVNWATRFYKNPTGPMEKDGKPTRLALTAAAWGEKVPKNNKQAREIYKKAVKRKQQLNYEN